MSILTVGSGRQYSTIAAAVNAAHDGDTVQVDAGTYTNDFATVGHKITLQGMGGMVRMVATVAPPNGKAILTTNTDVTVDHFEFTGAKVADMNGAGIRYQGGNLTVTDCYFHDNQDGLLAGAVAGGTITIRDSEFSHNGAGDGYSHNLYVGNIAKLTIDHSWFHDAVVGHEVKSRAQVTEITNSRITDGATGTASYSVDLPNGGQALLSGNVIEQGPHSQNPAIVHFGGEGTAYAGSALQMTGNTVLNDLASSSVRMVLNQTTTMAKIDATSTWGLGATQLASGPATVTGTVALTAEPALDTASPWKAATSATAAATTTATGTVLGSGAHSLVLKVSETAWQGDAQYSVKVDGLQIGGVQTAHASHTAHLDDILTVKGDWAAGSHVLEVTFLNDAYGGTAATDRNLYVDGVTYDGVALAKGTAALYSNGHADFAFG